MSPAAFVWAATSFALLCYIIADRLSKRRRRIKVSKGSYQISVIINKDLKMSNGKVLSQFGHAIDGILDLLKNYPDLANAWESNGSAKVVLKGNSEDLNQIYYNAKELGIPYYRVFDAGKTQIKTGSFTCIAIGPATKSQLEPITGLLSLY